VAPTTLVGGWQPGSGKSMEFKPGFKSPSAETNTVYAKAGREVGVYLGYYQDQDYDSKLVSSDNVLVASNDSRWSRVHSGTQSVLFGDQRASVRTAELGSLPLSAPDRAGPLIVWQIYWIDGTLTSSDYLAKAYSAMERLLGRGDYSAVIILYTVKSQTDDADATLQAFLSANYGAIDASLRQAKGIK
jgi:EpsI family protein